MAEQTTAADLIARRLYEAGCRFAFGIPGGEVLAMIDALARAGIRFVLTKHENNAGFMAEGVYQMTGAPGILVATLGPGAANAVNVTANAEQDRVPLIVLTGCVDAPEALIYTHQILDHQALFRPITKASFRLSEGNVEVLADKAVTLALDERPGPVHIDLPIALAAAPARPRPEPVRRARASPTAPAPGPDLEQARRWLAEAERPLLLAGLDVVNQDAAEAVADFAREFGVPLLTTYKAKGVMPEDEALALGGAGLSPTADRILLPLVKAADLILLAGYDPIEMRSGWRDAWDPTRQRVAEFQADGNQHYMHHANLSFTCHVGSALAALKRDVAPHPTWPEGEPARARQALAGAFAQDEAWGPAAIATTVRSVLPRDAVVTVDSGAHRILLSQVWQAYAPRTMLQSTGLCTMGCALPLAIGAKLAAPARAVVAFTGDAGLEMVLGELATLRDLQLPVVVVVFVDASLALIELKQRGTGLANLGVDFTETDFAALARALGGRGAVVENRETLAAEMSAALEAESFTVLACRIERGAYDGRL